MVRLRRMLAAAGLGGLLALLGTCALAQAGLGAPAVPTPPPAASAPPMRALQIDAEPITHDGPPRLQIDLRFDGDAGGSTLLYLPDQWASEAALYKAVRRLQVVSPGATLADTGNPAIKRITHAAGRPVHVRYELAQDFDGPIRTQAKYRPLLQPSYFHVIGHGMWVLPAWGKPGESGEADRLNVTLRWHGLPAGWTLANSFGAQQPEQRFEAGREQLLSAIYVGGDFRLTRAEVDGQPVYTAVRGSAWAFTDAQFNQMVARIVGLERDFWRARDPYFLVTLIPLEEPPSSFSVGGTGLTNSFATFVTPNAKPVQFERLITHEYFHNWNAHRLGRMPDQGEAAMYWLSEGFTDYYTHVLRLRGGLLTLPAFVDQVNEVLRGAYASPVRDADNARVVRDFWANPHVKDLPYLRGMLLAMQWNAQIRQASGGRQSLDDVMHGLLAAATAPDGQPAALTPAHVNSVLARFTGRDELPAMARHVTQGQALAPSPLWLGPHAQLVWQDLPVFELGFDRERLIKDKLVDGVVPGSAAWAAGLRDGQPIQGASIYGNDVNRAVQVKLRQDDGSVREVSFLPRAAQGVRVPQLKLPDNMSAEQRAQTLQWLGAQAHTGGP